jgi:hypothetical protein
MTTIARPPWRPNVASRHDNHSLGDVDSQFAFRVVLRGTPPDGAKGGIRIAQRELCDPWEPMETRRSGYFLVVKTSLPHESKKTEKGSLHPPMRKRSSKQNKNGGLGGESCAWRKGQVISRNSNITHPFPRTPIKRFNRCLSFRRSILQDAD